jgi:hypothetical protein
LRLQPFRNFNPAKNPFGQRQLGDDVAGELVMVGDSRRGVGEMKRGRREMKRGEMKRGRS